MDDTVTVVALELSFAVFRPTEPRSRVVQVAMCFPKGGTPVSGSNGGIMSRAGTGEAASTWLLQGISVPLFVITADNDFVRSCHDARPRHFSESIGHCTLD